MQRGLLQLELTDDEREQLTRWGLAAEVVAGARAQQDRPVEVYDRADLEGVRSETASGRTGKLSNGPLFVEKVYDIVGLYLPAYNRPPLRGSCCRAMVRAIAGCSRPHEA